MGLSNSILHNARVLSCLPTVELLLGEGQVLIPTHNVSTQGMAPVHPPDNNQTLTQVYNTNNTSMHITQTSNATQNTKIPNEWQQMKL